LAVVGVDAARTLVAFAENQCTRVAVCNPQPRLGCPR